MTTPQISAPTKALEASDREPRTKTPTIWIISELYYPEETSTGHVMTTIAEHLAHRGREVGAIAVQPTYSRRGVRAAQREWHGGVDITRAWSTTFDKNHILGRILNGITASVGMGAAAWRRIGRGDSVLVVTNPPLLPFLILLICRSRGARCVLLVHDVHPEQMVAFGMLQPNTIVVRLLKGAMRWLYRRLDHVVVIGRDMERVVREKSGSARVPITVATNWADETVVVPTDRRSNPLLQRLSWSDAFVVQYAGNMGRPNAIEMVLEAATLLRDHPRIRFLFVGSGAKLSWLQRERSSRHLTNVVVEPPVPRSAQTELLGACDVSIVPLIPGMFGLGVPSRTYNVLAAGRPLIAIAHPQSEIAQMILEERVGWVVPDVASPTRLASVIEDAASQSAESASALRLRARQAAEQKYAHHLILDRIARVLEPQLPEHK